MTYIVTFQFSLSAIVYIITNMMFVFYDIKIIFLNFCVIYLRFNVYFFLNCLTRLDVEHAFNKKPEF